MIKILKSRIVGDSISSGSYGGCTDGIHPTTPLFPVLDYSTHKIYPKPLLLKTTKTPVDIEVQGEIDNYGVF